MNTLSIPRAHIQRLCTGRKMLVEEVIQPGELAGDMVNLPTMARAKEISRRLAMPIANLLLGIPDDHDLDDGIRVARAGNAYTRTSEKNGRPYYTYRHLVTTASEPSLMALRVSLHCNSEEHVVLNGGHSEREFVYVTKGTVLMHWDTPQGRRKSELHVGDSAYLKPGVSHSFMGLEEDTELIAVNF